MSRLPWYKDGLNFKCTECGKCCSGSPGFVWVTEEEIRAMAALLAVSEKIFKMRYIRNRENRLALVEKRNVDGGYDCIFLRDRKCMVYQGRPQQCRTFPWWRENLTSPEAWKLAAHDCEGINASAPIVSCETIEQMLE